MLRVAAVLGIERCVPGSSNAVMTCSCMRAGICGVASTERDGPCQDVREGRQGVRRPAVSATWRRHRLSGPATCARLASRARVRSSHSRDGGRGSCADSAPCGWPLPPCALRLARLWRVARRAGQAHHPLHCSPRRPDGEGLQRCLCGEVALLLSGARR